MTDQRWLDDQYPKVSESDRSGTDAMRLLEAIATIIDGPIADTRLHDWSGLPERVRLKVQRLYDKWQDAEDCIRLRMRELNAWRLDSGLEPLPALPDAEETR